MKKLIAALSAALNLWTTEARTGITLIDAADASAFEQELRRVTRSSAERADIRRAAIVLAQCGGTASDVEPAMRALYTKGTR